jgi:hypothetical protein
MHLQEADQNNTLPAAAASGMRGHLKCRPQEAKTRTKHKQASTMTSCDVS